MEVWREDSGRMVEGWWKDGGVLRSGEGDERRYGGAFVVGGVSGDGDACTLVYDDGDCVVLAFEIRKLTFVLCDFDLVGNRVSRILLSGRWCMDSGCGCRASVTAFWSFAFRERERECYLFLRWLARVSFFFFFFFFSDRRVHRSRRIVSVPRVDCKLHRCGPLQNCSRCLLLLFSMSVY